MSAARPRRRRWLRWLLLAALALLVTAGVVLGWLQSEWGGESIRSRAVEAANQQLSGKLEVKGMRLFGDQLHLSGVKLYTREGELVASVDQLDATVALLALTAGRVQLKRLTLRGVFVDLSRDEGGLKLARAVAPKELKPVTPASTSSGGPLDVGIGALELSDVTLRALDPSRPEGDPLREVSLTAAGKGEVHFFRPPETLQAVLTLEGQTVKPLADPLTLSVAASGRLEALAGRLELKLGDEHLRAGFDLAKKQVQLEALKVTPRWVGVFAPEAKLKAPVELAGTLSETHVTLDGTAAGGVHLDASLQGVTGPTPTVPAFELKLTQLSPAELVEGAPAVTLDAALSGSLTDADPKHLTGALHGAATVKAKSGTATFELKAEAREGGLRVNPLRVAAPGVKLTVKGSAKPDALALDGVVQVDDLARAAAFGAGLAGQPAPEISGLGALAVRVDGSLKHPGVSLDGAFARLAAPSLVLEGVEARVTVPDLRQPREAHAVLQVDSATLGEQRIEHFGADVSLAGNGLTGKLTAQALEQMSLSFGGELSNARDALQLSSLELDYPGTRWALTAPSQLSWGEGRWKVEPLTLTAGPQSLALQGERKKGQLEAQVKVQHFDLSRLPQVLRKGLEPEGQVDLTLTAQGPAAQPALNFELLLAQGKVLDFSGLALDAKGRVEKGRLVAQLKLSSPVGALDGQVDAALAWKKERQSVELRLDTLDVGALLEALKQPRSVEGKATASITFEGTLDAPRATLRVEASRLDACRGACLEGGPRLALSALKLLVTAEPDRPLTLSAGVSLLHGTAELNASAAATLAQLVEGKPLQAKQAPLQARLQLMGLDLSGLQEAGFTEVDLAQRVSLDARLAGSALHPDVDAWLDATGSAVGATAAGADGEKGKLAKALQLVSHLELHTGRAKTATQGWAKLGDRGVLAFHGSLAAALEAVPTATKAPLELEADLGPLELASFLPRGPLNRAPAEMGSVDGSLKLSGTAEKPVGSFKGQLKDLRFQKVNLGKVALAWSYDDAKHAATVHWESPKGGALDLKATAELDVGVEALKKGLSPLTAPFTAQLQAEHFDVSAGSGLSPTVRTLGGLLDANLKAEGHLDAPHLQGRVEWTGGRLSSSFGDYREARLSAEVKDFSVKLNRLYAKAGEGELEVTGELKQKKDGFDVTADVRLDHLPIVTDDQLFAIATTRVHAEGGRSGTITEVDLGIPEAHVELPQVKRKDLQDLERPKDIVLVRGGGLKPKPKPKSKEDVSDQALQQRAERFTLVLDAPKNLWLKSSDLNLELGLSDGFQVELSRGVELYGEAHVLQGRIDVIGRRFDVEKNSAVRFQGPPTAPYVNLTAIHKNEREGVTVFVTVVGKGKDLALKTSSQPPLSDNDIFTLLATGRRTLKRGGGSSISGGQAASVLGALAASQLKTMVAKKLPLDVLSIDTGAEGLERARVEAGTYLSDDLYLGYQLQLGADKAKGENQHAVRLEYQLGRNWTVEGGAGDAPAASADVMWSRDY